MLWSAPPAFLPLSIDSAQAQAGSAQAQATTPQASTGQASPPLSPAKPKVIEQIIPFVFIFLLFYLILIRPAQKRQKNHQNLIQQLKKGDKVITNSGILGIIHGLTDTFVTLEVAQNVRIRILRSQISSLAETETKTNPTKSIPKKP